jgi:hypothetical protein
MSRKLVEVYFGSILPNGDYWIENETDGVDTDLRVTRGPYTLRNEGPFWLFLENRTIYDHTLPKDTLIGNIEEAILKNSSKQTV